MSEKLYATFDGEIFRPERPVSFAPNTRVRLTIEEASEDEAPEVSSFLKTARSLELKGPGDWSDRLEDYLYDDASKLAD